MTSVLPPTYVCSRAEAGKRLCKGDAFGLIVSIAQPGVRRPSGMAQARTRGSHIVRQFFDDCERDAHGYVGCTAEHVRELIRTAPLFKVPTLVHCAAGISRSTAAALVLATARLGRGSERDVCAWLPHVCARRPDSIAPNRRIIYMADRLLGRRGAFYEEFDAAFGDRRQYGMPNPLVIDAAMLECEPMDGT